MKLGDEAKVGRRGKERIKERSKGLRKEGKTVGNSAVNFVT